MARMRKYFAPNPHLFPYVTCLILREMFNVNVCMYVWCLTALQRKKAIRAINPI